MEEDEETYRRFSLMKDMKVRVTGYLIALLPGKMLKHEQAIHKLRLVLGKVYRQEALIFII